MSYDDHTDCGFCRRHSVDCWCYSTNLWTDEAKNDRTGWCHKPDDPSLHVPQPPSVLRGDGDVLGRIRDAYRLIESAPPPRAEPIKLTEQQIAAIRRQQPERPAWDSGVVADLFAVPIVKVDTVEQSTPHMEAPKYATGGLIRRGELGPLLDEGGCSYVIPRSYGNHTNCGLCRKHSINCWCALWPAEIAGDRSNLCHKPDDHARRVRPGGILTIPRALSAAELERIACRWAERHGGTGNAHRAKLLGRHPWPWWKRTYYRVRRWMA